MKNQITKSSGNVFRDLGCKTPDTMLIKAKLVYKIQQIIEARKLTQTQAAEIMKISQPRLSEMLNGHFRLVSEVKIIACLLSLGHDVKIVVGDEEKPKQGNFDVVFA